MTPNKRENGAEAFANLPISAPDGKNEARVLKADTANLVSSAEQLLADAKTEAEHRIRRAEQEAVAIRQHAISEAKSIRTKAREEGLETGKRHAASQITEDQTRAARNLADLDQRIGMLVMGTLSKVLTEADCEESFFRSAVRRVLAAVRDEKLLTIRVHPSQLESAQRAVDSVVQAVGANQYIDVLTDTNLKKGTCLVETPHGVVDASLDTQLETIRHALTTIWTYPDDRRTV